MFERFCERNRAPRSFHFILEYNLNEMKLWFFVIIIMMTIIIIIAYGYIIIKPSLPQTHTHERKIG